MTTVLGIDGGFASLGWAVLSVNEASATLINSGVIRTEKSARKQEVRASDDNFRRCQEIHTQLARLIGIHEPQLLCMEAFSPPRNASNGSKMGMAFGVIAALADNCGLPVLQASPQDIKKALCGKKTATKEEIQMVVESRFPNIEWPKQTSLWEHVGDAVAVVLACENSNAMKMARRMAS